MNIHQQGYILDISLVGSDTQQNGCVADRASIWQGQRGSNPRHAVLETAARTYLYYYKRGVHMVEIRVIGEADELRQAEKAIEQMFDVVDKSKFYDCRDDAQRKRLYIKANIKTATDK